MAGKLDSRAVEKSRLRYANDGKSAQQSDMTPESIKDVPPPQRRKKTIPTALMRLFPQDGEQNRRGVGSHAEARVQFHAPTMNRRGFPRLPHVRCRVREGLRAMLVPSSGQGPFRLAWTEACPDFQKVLPTKGGITSCREKRRSGGLNAEVAAVRTRLKRPPLQCPDSPVRFAFREDCPERSETACYRLFKKIRMPSDAVRRGLQEK